MADPQTFIYSVIHSEVVGQVVLVRGAVLANGAGETSLNLIKFRIFTHRVLADVLDESSFGLQTLSTIAALPLFPTCAVNRLHVPIQGRFGH